MTWHKPTQDSFAGLDFSRWSPKQTPAPAPVKAKDKIGTFARRLKQDHRPAWGQSQSLDDWQRMWVLKQRMAERMANGETHEAALAAVKRELWPSEYRSERGE